MSVSPRSEKLFAAALDRAGVLEHGARATRDGAEASKWVGSPCPSTTAPSADGCSSESEAELDCPPACAGPRRPALESVDPKAWQQVGLCLSLVFAACDSDDEGDELDVAEPEAWRQVGERLAGVFAQALEDEALEH